MRAHLSLTLVCTLAFGGGWAFKLLGLPAPWLAGAMVTTAAASLYGIRAAMPEWLKHATFVVLGLQIGASFTWQSIESIARWPLSLFVLAATVLMMIGAGTLFFRRAYAWNISTAFFSSVPGALGMTLALAGDRDADIARVAIVQCIRLFVLVALFPMLVQVTGSVGVIASANDTPAGLDQLAMICLIGTVCGYAAHRLGVPAGFLLGAMAGNAAAHLTGAVAGGIPQWMLIPAFVLLGTSVGIRFQGISIGRLKQLISASLAGFLVALVIAAAGAFVASWLTGLPVIVTLLAFAPGGLEIMTILAFALGLNPAFVATHQVARYLGLSISLPLISVFAHRRWRN